MSSLCGFHSGKVVLLQEKGFKLRFKSDDTFEGRGFSIRVHLIVSDCSSELRNVSEGIIMSPSYPSNYKAFQTCIWKIVVPEGKRIRLTFREPFEVITSKPTLCGQDYLMVSKSGDLNEDNHR